MKARAIIREIISTIITFLVVFAVVWGIQKTIVQPFKVDGHSMDYTLQHGERLFMWKLANIDRFDVVILKAPSNPEEKLYVKRVIGLPGDTVEVKDNKLILNGKAMDEPYLAQKQAEYSGNFTEDFNLESITGKAKIPEGYVFVMGDNRQNSLDGRSFGLIPMDYIIGEADVVMWPVNKLGMLTKYKLNDTQDKIVER
ncbi:signal peptidase I [Tuanshanicoccus lijuaniae]|uniref:signal peptidase I n=1 Tax=Aerococcaceae bacterium zg-1292 TaxID=2774330 RepID=UPI001937DEF1|nr:signal peptidase I [Aerococcaceae bacterium zg-1292]QQA37317.1 signal peptidase I [Aerococcaceae bacterium zg-1292]